MIFDVPPEDTVCATGLALIISYVYLLYGQLLSRELLPRAGAAWAAPADINK